MKKQIIFLLSALFFVFNLYNCSELPLSKVESSDGVEIAFEAKGSGDIALVFIHGWSCDKSYWRNQINELSKSYKIVTIDLAGHGESGLNRENRIA